MMPARIATMYPIDSLKDYIVINNQLNHVVNFDITFHLHRSRLHRMMRRHFYTECILDQSIVPGSIGAV